MALCQFPQRPRPQKSSASGTAGSKLSRLNGSTPRGEHRLNQQKGSRGETLAIHKVESPEMSNVIIARNERANVAWSPIMYLPESLVYGFCNSLWSKAKENSGNDRRASG